MTFGEHKEAFWEYVEWCLDPANPVSRWVRKLCAKFKDEWARKDDAAFPFYFDEDAVEHVTDVLGELQLANGKWMGSPFKLLRWQRLVVFLAYGWKWKENKQRRYTEVFIKIPRKNGKTEFLAAIGIYGQSFDPYEKACQVWWFATKKEQAAIGFEAQKAMAKYLIAKSPYYSSEVRTLQYRIADRNSTGYTSYLGKNSDRVDGFGPFYAICDEFHAHETNAMRGVVKTGMMARDSPMMWTISTEGHQEDSPFTRMDTRCKQALEGIIEMPQTLALLCELDPEDDWTDPKNWGKANASLGESFTIDNMLREYRDAMEKGPDEIREFQTKNLNIRQKKSEVWIHPADWKANTSGVSRDELMKQMKGRLCFGGLDLASTRDLCSFVLMFPPETESEKWVLLHWSWAPEASISHRVKVDQAPYMEFLQRGELIATQKKMSDYSVIKEHILWCQDEFFLHSVAFDRYNAYQVIPEIEEYGVRMEAFSQSFASFNAPTNTLEMLAVEGLLEHGGDKLLGWAVNNVVIDEKDGMRRPVKQKSREKIDPAVATIMAIGQTNEYLQEMTSGSDWSPVVVLGLK